MSTTDEIADLLTRIRNASRAKHKYVDARYSRMNIAIAKVLAEAGYIKDHIEDEKSYRVRLFLKYRKGVKHGPVIHQLKRLSKCGQRFYVKSKAIPHVMSGLGLTVLSTSQGVMSGEKARELKIGGELLFSVW